MSIVRVLTQWDYRWLRLAQHVSEWSKDPSTKVGAVVARGKDFISLGYNGFPEGIEDTPERLNNRDLKLELMIHAEKNALRRAGPKAEGASIYVWPFMPCLPCALESVTYKVREVVAPLNDTPRWQASFDKAAARLHEAKVQLILVQGVVMVAA